MRKTGQTVLLKGNFITMIPERLDERTMKIHMSRVNFDKQ